MCLTLCDAIDGSPPGSSVPGILQARTLEWVAISFSNACMHAKLLQSLQCPTLCNPMDSSPPGSSVHRILQARILEWVAISFSQQPHYVNTNLFLENLKENARSVLFSSVAQLCPTLCDPMDHHQLLQFTQTHVHWVGDAIQPSHPLCHPLLLPPSIFPSFRVFSNESVLCIRWPKYWSFSFSISPSNEYSGLISFKMKGRFFLISAEFNKENGKT